MKKLPFVSAMAAALSLPISLALAGNAFAAKPVSHNRAEIPAEYRWDFTPIYANWEAWEAAMMQQAVDPDVAIAMLEQFRAFDVRPLLEAVQAPTLVLHRRGDQAWPFDGGRELAAGIPNAHFVPMAGAWHALYEQDEQDVLQHVLAHLEDRDEAAAVPPTPPVSGQRPVLLLGSSLGAGPYPDGLTAREVEVLRLIAAGQSSREIAAALVIAEGTVTRHVTNLYGKIGARGRADATAYAFQQHLVEPRSA